jgi:DeoR family transcriptional regulator, suf operon transcriptional repressor
MNMPAVIETSDSQVLGLLQQHGPLGIGDLVEHMGVTPTAVRQRLARLREHGLIGRETEKAARGRPSHRYLLTEKGRREAGHNFADLAVALWQEVRAIKDPDVRHGLLKRVAKSVAAMYAPRVQSADKAGRMREVAELFVDRRVPFSVEGTKELPVLTAWACPYPALAEQDRGVCAMENMVFTELVGQKVKLSECRLDGGTCCRFETS